MISIKPAFFLLLFFSSVSQIFSQNTEESTRNTFLQIGFTDSYFLGNDLPLRANRAISPGFCVGILTRQSPRIKNGFAFSMDFPTSRSIGRKDTLTDFDFIYYQTRISKFEFYLEYNIIKDEQELKSAIPYIHAGIGWIKLKQKMIYNGEKVFVHSMTGEDYQKKSLVLPLGVGLRYNLANRANIAIEALYNYTFINQLDLDYMNKFSYSKGRDSYLNVNVKLSFL